MSSLSYESILEALAALSFADKLLLNEELATALRKEGKSGAVGKALKKEKKAKDPSAAPRKTAVGTMAWIAFVKHCKTTLPERFTECAKEPERLQVAKAIRAEDEAAYKEFCEKFKEEHASAAGSDEDSSDSEASPRAAAPAPAPKEAKPAAISPAEKAAKLAALKKGPALAGGAAAAAGGGAAAAPTPKEKPAAAKKEKKAAPAKEEKPAKAKKEPKSAKKPAAAAAEEAAPEWATKEIDGCTYFFDPETNGLWNREEDGGFGAWVGRFQPGNEEEPIRFTDSPADE